MDRFYFCSRGYNSPQISRTRINVAKRGEIRLHVCGFLFNFSKMTENAIITIKLLIFSHIFSDVAIGPENSPSLN